MPPFDLSDAGGIGLVLMRGVSDIALALTFGTALLRSAVLPSGLAAMAEKPATALALTVRRTERVFALFTILWLFLWLVFVGRDLADATTLGTTLSAAETVFGQTSFGHVVLYQMAALLAVFACGLSAKGIPRLIGLAAAASALGLQACHGHGFSMGDVGLLIINMLHVLAAGAWLGSLPALFLAVRLAPLPALGPLCRAYSPLGQIAVLLLAVTALLQGLVMIRTWHNLFTTAYGWTAMLKIALMLALLMVAAFNRLWVTNSLAGGQSNNRTRRFFIRSLSVEILLGAFVILAAGLLASLPPVMAM